MPYRIDTVDLFPKIGKHLIELLESLEPEDWNHPTQFPNWTVKDIVAHLLDTSIRRLSSQRDGYRSTRTNGSNRDGLVQRITDLANRWASTFESVSPRILCEMTRFYQDELAKFLATVELNEPSAVPVSWAGQTQSRNWFDIAREYTERWHHQMQLRVALGRPDICSRELYFPVLDTFMEALPHHYQSFTKPDGSLLLVEVRGSAGGKWWLRWKDGKPRLLRDATEDAHTKVMIEQEIAWKVFTKFNERYYEKKVEIVGDSELGDHLLQMKCLMI